MNHKSRIGLILAAALGFTSLAGCGPTDDSSSGKLAYKPGVVISLTGDLSAFGPTYADIDRLAVGDLKTAITSAGLAGTYSVSLVSVEDDQTEATAAVEAANKVVAGGANVIIGSLSSTATAAIANAVSIPKGVLQVAPGSTATSLSTLADNGLLYRTVPSDGATAQALVSQLKHKLPAGAKVNVGVRDDPFGTGYRDAFVKGWRAAGGKIGANIAWDPNQAAFDTEAQKLVAGDPDAWVVIDFPTTWAKFGPALVRTGRWSPDRTYTNQGLETSDLGKLAGRQTSEGLTGIDPTTAGPAAQALEARFKKDHANAPYDAFAPNNYDAIVVPFLAMAAAGSDDPSKIAGAMQKVTKAGAKVYTSDQLADAIKAVSNGAEIDYQGPTGALHFDENGDPAGGTFQTWVYENGAVSVKGTFSTTGG